MKFMSLDLEEKFFCKFKKMEVALGKCLDDYMSATVFEQKDEVCFQCATGASRRRRFAGDFEPGAVKKGRLTKNALGLGRNQVKR